MLQICEFVDLQFKTIFKDINQSVQRNELIQYRLENKNCDSSGTHEYDKYGPLFEAIIHA